MIIYRRGPKKNLSMDYVGEETGGLAVAPDFDECVYDDILASIRRQGFYDCLGSDLIPASYDNVAYGPIDHSIWRMLYSADARAKQQAEEEAYQRRRRERRAEEKAEAARKAEEKRLADEAELDRRAEELAARRRRAETLRQIQMRAFAIPQIQALSVWEQIEMQRPVKSREQKRIDAELRAFWKRRGR